MALDDALQRSLPKLSRTEAASWCTLNRKISLLQIILVAILALSAYSHVSRNLLEHQRFPNFGFRLGVLQSSLDCYHETGQYFLIKNREDEYVAWENTGDDWGLHVSLVTMARLYSLIDNARPDAALHYLLLGLGLNLLYAGFSWKACLDSGKRDSGTLLSFLAVVALGFTIFDVYAASLLPAGLFILLLVRSSQERYDATYIVTLALFSFACVFSEFTRAKTGLILALVLLAYLLVCRRKMAVFLLIFCLGSTVLTNLWLGSLQSSRDLWLSQTYGKPKAIESLESHAIWHSLFVGLSYDKIDGIPWDDVYAFRLVDTKEGFGPTEQFRYSAKYDEEMKKHYLRVVSEHPFATLYSYLKRYLVIAGPLLLLSGLWGADRWKVGPQDRHFTEKIALLSAAMLLMIPAAVVRPFPMYYLTSIALAPAFRLFSKSEEKPTRPS